MVSIHVSVVHLAMFYAHCAKNLVSFINLHAVLSFDIQFDKSNLST